jgi:hypothetical protein
VIQQRKKTSGLLKPSTIPVGKDSDHCRMATILPASKTFGHLVLTNKFQDQRKTTKCHIEKVCNNTQNNKFQCKEKTNHGTTDDL